jgi:hypothetical protein
MGVHCWCHPPPWHPGQVRLWSEGTVEVGVHWSGLQELGEVVEVGVGVGEPLAPHPLSLEEKKV